MEEFCGAGSYFAKADDTYSLALEFTSDQTVFGLSGSAAGLNRLYVAEDVQDHSEDQFGNRFVGVAGSVADCDPFFPGGVEADMIDSCKSHIDKFKSGAAADHFAGHGHVGNDHGIGVFGFFDQRRDICGAGKISKGMSFVFERFLAHSQFLRGNAEGFHNYDFTHVVLPFCCWWFAICYNHYSSHLT